jgi:hypothetical protein
MRANLLRVGCIITIVLSACFVSEETTQAALTTNSWSGSVGGKWEDSADWSEGAPSVTQAVVFLSNVVVDQPAITTTIDATTAGTFPSTMTISNLVIGDATIIASHELILSDTSVFAPLRVLNSLFVTNHGSIYLTNSTLCIDGPPASSSSEGAFGIEGSVTVDADATLIAQTTTNLIAFGEAVGVNGSGTLIISGGTNLVGLSSLVLGQNVNSFGNVLITGGALLVTNTANGFGSGIDIGNNGVGNLTQSNGFVMALGESMGQGTLTVAAGTHLTGSLDVDGGFKATGTVWVTGGALLVTNGVSEGTVLGTDTSGSSGILTVSNGIFATTLLVLGYNAGDAGTLTVAGGTANVLSNLVIANSLTATGVVTMTGGLLTVTNNETDVGSSGVGQMMISGGTVLASDIVVGNLSGSRGTLTMAGGTNTLSAGLTVGNLANATGTVWVTGGQLDAGIQSIILGYSGVSQMTVSNGTVLAAQLAVAFGFGSHGTFTLAGGTVTPSVLEIGLNTATGTVWVTGGQLGPYLAQIGRSGRGQLTVSNGTVEVGSSMSIGVGIAPGFSQGSLTVVGGSVAVTNFSSTGVLVVGQADTGNYTQNGGTVTVDNLLVTNLANSVFTFNGGTFQTKATTVSNTLQCAVGNGATAATYHLIGGIHSFNNGLRIRNNATLSGCGTIDGNVLVDDGGTVVADCGGSLTFNGSVTNNGTMQAINGSVLEAYGTVVNNGLIDITGGTTNFHGTFVNNGSIIGGAVPAFQITSITQQGNNILVSWQTSAGKTNELQVTAGGVGGSYSTNSFAAIFAVTNTVSTVTNYQDVGGATNFPARYYRVHQIP